MSLGTSVIVDRSVIGRCHSERCARVLREEATDLSVRLQLAEGRNHKEVRPRALQRYQKAVENLEERLNGRVERAREILRSLIGGPIRIHQREGRLEAELRSSMRAMVAAALGPEVDLRGCGGQ